MVTVCIRQVTTPALYIAANRHYTPHTATLVKLIPFVPSELSGTIASSRHYSSTGTIEELRYIHFGMFLSLKTTKPRG